MRQITIMTCEDRGIINFYEPKLKDRIGMIIMTLTKHPKIIINKNCKYINFTRRSQKGTKGSIK